MKIAIIGATGLVGQEIIKVLGEQKIIYSEIILVGSEKSVGKSITIDGEIIQIKSINEALEKKPDFAIFSAGSIVSLKWAPKFAEIGTTVIDNSSAWRMHDNIPLIIPEINFESIKLKHDIKVPLTLINNKSIYAKYIHINPLVHFLII